MKVLIHVCCAVCGGYVIEKLKSDGHEVSVYFYNPNIFPEEEYALRLNELKRYADELGAKLIPSVYNHEEWLDAVKQFKDEKEGGRRCDLCFTHRLGEACQKARELGCDAVATTLTMGTQKPVDLINEIGKEMANFYNVRFIDTVWRKNEGVKRTNAIAKEKDFYRQDYCGCEFSGRRETTRN